MSSLVEKNKRGLKEGGTGEEWVVFRKRPGYGKLFSLFCQTAVKMLGENKNLKTK